MNKDTNKTTVYYSNSVFNGNEPRFFVSMDSDGKIVLSAHHGADQYGIRIDLVDGLYDKIFDAINENFPGVTYSYEKVETKTGDILVFTIEIKLKYQFETLQYKLPKIQELPRNKTMVEKKDCEKGKPKKEKDDDDDDDIFRAKEKPIPKVVETSKATTSKVELPKTDDKPKTEIPKTEVSKDDKPKIVLPKEDKSKTEVPKAESELKTKMVKKLIIDDDKEEEKPQPKFVAVWLRSDTQLLNTAGCYFCVRFSQEHLFTIWVPEGTVVKDRSGNQYILVQDFIPKDKSIPPPKPMAPFDIFPGAIITMFGATFEQAVIPMKGVTLLQNCPILLKSGTKLHPFRDTTALTDDFERDCLEVQNDVPMTIVSNAGAK